MEFLIDTADLPAIEDAAEHLPLAGLTCNPSIIKKSAPKDFFAHMQQIRKIIGDRRTLHIQILAENSADQLQEAEQIFANVGPQTYIKVPVTWEGLKTIQALKAMGKHATATAVYDIMQAYLALDAGADYIAPYYNRIANTGGDPDELIRRLSNRIEHDHYACKIVAASFHSIQQVQRALDAGTQAVTVDPVLLKSVFSNACIHKAVTDFAADWQSVYGPDAGIDAHRK